MKYSKNKRAEELMGLRSKGQPIDLPCELGYNCPICHNHCKQCDDGEGLHDETLEFSEYNDFMWCPKCNIDIPSFMCLRAVNIELVKTYTERYLNAINDIRQDEREKVMELIEE